uniref:Uncharacterized protein n=1 Tax=Arundo donax TaxID=35708 RepID=A0A0A8ZE15_ARUDO
MRASLYTPPYFPHPLLTRHFTHAPEQRPSWRALAPRCPLPCVVPPPLPYKTRAPEAQAPRLAQPRSNFSELPLLPFPPSH